ncbi:cell division protein ZapB [Psychromonas antarctica]|jgi:cell division protein ZapB|uniref:cell division protein ZapB n=1 Tax=Psychromonas antarctica TaxID=67573 RepID=UPI001EE8F132|nr:cell division protein ZapB [Psychromonas antarctica]MCG6201454.1 cell division protein ZapB [Psychromonas antarctica]
MTLDLLEKLESKIQNAIDTIALLQMEVEELKEDKQGLAEKNGHLEAENIRLSEEHQQWQSRLSTLVGKIEEAEGTL